MADSIVDSITEWMFGGKKTKPLRSPGPMDPKSGQDNSMVKAAAEEAARRARTRGELAPETQSVLTAKPKKLTGMVGGK